MASFKQAVYVVLQHEGLLSEDPADHGGTTNYGISLGFLKAEGIDIDGDGDSDAIDVRELSKEKAMDIYEEYFWDRHQYGRIFDQQVATKVFDLAVNMGAKRLHKLLQRALCSIGLPVAVDGIFGQETLNAVNCADPDQLHAALRKEADRFYRSLNQPRFLEGWLRRLYS